LNSPVDAVLYEGCNEDRTALFPVVTLSQPSSCECRQTLVAAIRRIAYSLFINCWWWASC
jgi:hypothetical protein